MMEYQIEENTVSESSGTLAGSLKYGFIAFLIFILTIGVPSIAVFLGIKFLPAMILWALSEVWLINVFLGCVPILCTAAASLILIGCIYLACYLFRYLSKLSDKKNENLKLGNSTKRNWLKRILAFFGCLAFGLSTVIFPACVLVLTVDAIYIALVLIALVVIALIGGGVAMAQGGGCDGPNFSSSHGSHKISERDEDKLDNSHCGFLDWFPGPKAFYCCLKILFSGENPMYKEYHELRNKCFVEVNNLLADKTVNENCFDQLLEKAQNVNSADRKKLRTEIVKIIIDKKIIPLVVILATKQNKSVEQIFGLQKISENQQQGILKFANFKDGIIKLLSSANINENSNMQLASKEEIKKANQAKYLENGSEEGSAAPVIQICQQSQTKIINDNDKNMDSNKPKHNINCNDENRKKLIMAWNCCLYSIEKYLDDTKNQRSLYKNLIQEEAKQKGNKNEIIVG